MTRRMKVNRAAVVPGSEEELNTRVRAQVKAVLGEMGLDQYQSELRHLRTINQKLYNFFVDMKAALLIARSSNHNSSTKATLTDLITHLSGTVDAALTLTDMERYFTENGHPTTPTERWNFLTTSGQ